MTLKINIGCGMTPIEGWKNFDNSMSIKLAKKTTFASVLSKFGILSNQQKQYINFAKLHDIIWADATAHIPIEENSVDILYSSHMLEHLERSKAESFLKEALRVLKPNGIIRIVVPDLNLFIRQYLENGDADEFVSKLFMHKPQPHSFTQKIKDFIVGDRHHQWNYDGNSLSKLLLKVGFKNPTVLEAGSTTISNPTGLNLCERQDESLYVEANK